jgi:hypothetical protein
MGSARPMSRRRLTLSSAIGLLIVLAVIGFLLQRRNSASTPESVAKNESVAYVLQAEGKWQRQTGGTVKPGDELRTGDSLTPEPADKSSILRIYEYGKGPKMISGERGTYQIAGSTGASAGPADWLAVLLPRVKDVFPEETISRGELEEPYMGPLLVSDKGVDVGPLREHEAKGRVRQVRLRFLNVPSGSSQAARPSPSPKQVKSREFAYRWDPARLTPVAGSEDLEPGLYRLQVWSTSKGTPLPPLDSATPPDGEHLVALVRGDHDYQEARREYDRMVQRIDHEWDKDLPADLRAAFIKASLLHIAEQYAPAAGKG